MASPQGTLRWSVGDLVSRAHQRRWPPVPELLVVAAARLQGTQSPPLQVLASRAAALGEGVTHYEPVGPSGPLQVIPLWLYAGPGDRVS